MKGLIPLTALMLLASACSGGEDLDQNEDSGTTSSSAADLSGETVEVAATWTGAEQDRFQMVLDAFAEQTGASVRFRSAGDDVAAYVGPRIEGGDPPDVAILPQPGVLQTFAKQGDLVDIEDVAGDEVDANFGETAREVGPTLLAQHPRGNAVCHLGVVGVRQREPIVERREGEPEHGGRGPHDDWPHRLPSTRPHKVRKTISPAGSANRSTVSSRVTNASAEISTKNRSSRLVTGALMFRSR